MSRNPWLFAAALIVAAVLGAGAFAAAQAMMPSKFGDQARIEHVVRDYLLANPEILPEAMQRLQAKEQARASADAKKVLAANGKAISTPFPGASAGNPNGDVTVVAFLDYACGYCRASLPAIAELLRRDPKVRIVYREYPVLGDDSETAARWALAAAEQGKFKPFHDALYSVGRPTAQAIQAAAKVAGIDTARASAALKSEAVVGEIANNRSIGGKLNMNGTPAWVVGDQVIHGAIGYDDLAAAVATARKAG